MEKAIIRNSNAGPLMTNLLLSDDGRPEDMEKECFASIIYTEIFETHGVYPLKALVEKRNTLHFQSTTASTYTKADELHQRWQGMSLIFVLC